MSTVLVVGAAPNSLGHYVKKALMGYGYSVITAGLGEEDFQMDISHPHTYAKTLRSHQFNHVVVTAGINQDYGNYGNITDWMNEHMKINCYGPMNLLQMWLKYNRPPGPTSHFVAVSSNSAFIPRRNSMAYCASKAALSMSLRVAAREEAMGDQRAIIYGYEPGLLIGTPMTKETEKRFGPSATRIPGNPHGLHPDDIAHQIAANIHVGGWALNGVLVRADGGEN